MPVNGCDCSILIKTSHCEKDIPYSDETLREAVSLLVEEAAIEGNGGCRAIRKPIGITGCVVTPLTIGTAPLLFYLAMGSAGNPIFISGTRNLYQSSLDLLPLEDSERFDLIQDRGGERRLFESCRVKGFELRIMRGEAIKLKLDVFSDFPPMVYNYTDIFSRQTEERFNGDFVTYRINGKEYRNIYGLTIAAKKENGTKTEIWIKRAKDKSSDIPGIIDEMTVTAQLLRDTYEYKRFGMFRITLKRLVMTSDETEINTPDTVIGPIRYYVSGPVTTEVFSSGSEAIQ
jgi:hypothetical protein